MTSKVIVTRTVGDKAIGAGITYAKTLFNLLNRTDGSVIQTQEVSSGETEVTFTGLVDGSYAVNVIDQDTTGADIGEAASAVFDVAPTAPATFQGTTGVSVAVSAE